jgi:hypothetical protein
MASTNIDPRSAAENDDFSTTANIAGQTPNAASLDQRLGRPFPVNVDPDFIKLASAIPHSNEGRGTYTIERLLHSVQTWTLDDDADLPDNLKPIATTVKAVLACARLNHKGVELDIVTRHALATLMTHHELGRFGLTSPDELKPEDFHLAKALVESIKGAIIAMVKCHDTVFGMPNKIENYAIAMWHKMQLLYDARRDIYQKQRSCTDEVEQGMWAMYLGYADCMIALSRLHHSAASSWEITGQSAYGDYQPYGCMVCLVGEAPFKRDDGAPKTATTKSLKTGLRALASIFQLVNTCDMTLPFADPHRARNHVPDARLHVVNHFEGTAVLKKIMLNCHPCWALHDVSGSDWCNRSRILMDPCALTLARRYVNTLMQTMHIPFAIREDRQTVFGPSNKICWNTMDFLTRLKRATGTDCPHELENDVLDAFLGLFDLDHTATIG